MRIEAHRVEYSMMKMPQLLPITHFLVLGPQLQISVLNRWDDSPFIWGEETRCLSGTAITGKVLVAPSVLVVRLIWCRSNDGVLWESNPVIIKRDPLFSFMDELGLRSLQFHYPICEDLKIYQPVVRYCYGGGCIDKGLFGEHLHLTCRLTQYVGAVIRNSMDGCTVGWNLTQYVGTVSGLRYVDTASQHGGQKAYVDTLWGKG